MIKMALLAYRISIARRYLNMKARLPGTAGTGQVVITRDTLHFLAIFDVRYP